MGSSFKELAQLLLIPTDVNNGINMPLLSAHLLISVMLPNSRPSRLRRLGNVGYIEDRGVN